MVGWHHRLSRHEFEETLGDGEGHGRLQCFILWGHKESFMTETEQQQQPPHFWSSFSELSEVLSPGLQSSFCPK